MPRRLAAALLLASPALTVPATAAASEPAFETALADFRKLHRSEVRRSGIAGSSFYLVRDGRTVAADHLGERDSEAHPSNRSTAESRIALATDSLCEALAKAD